MERKDSRANEQPEIEQENLSDRPDVEAGKEKQEMDAQLADPFGDEEGAEVKYKTMTWW